MSLPGAEKHKKLAEPPAHGHPQLACGHGCWPARSQAALRMRSGCRLQVQLRTASVCPPLTQHVQNNLETSSHRTAEPALLAVSGPKKHSGRAGRVGQFPFSQKPGRRQLPLACQLSLHTGVSSATFFRKPAASRECWVASAPSMSRIFRCTFWLVLLHSVYSW